MMETQYQIAKEEFDEFIRGFLLTEDPNMVMLGRSASIVLGSKLFSIKIWNRFSTQDQGRNFCAAMDHFGWEFNEGLTTLFEQAIFKRKVAKVV